MTIYCQRIVFGRILYYKIYDDSTDRITAFCHLRNDGRTFKFDGIKEAFNPQTKEVLTELLGVKINSPDELKLGVMDFQNRVPKTVIKKLRLPLDPKVSEKISEYLVSISGAIKAVQYAITVFRGKSGKIRTRHIDIIREMIISNTDIPEDLHEYLTEWILENWYEEIDDRGIKYQKFLDSIPDEMYSICRFYLIKMVSPCIRKPKPSVMEKIHKEFTKGGKVIPLKDDA